MPNISIGLLGKPGGTGVSGDSPEPLVTMRDETLNFDSMSALTAPQKTMYRTAVLSRSGTKFLGWREGMAERVDHPNDFTPASWLTDSITAMSADPSKFFWAQTWAVLSNGLPGDGTAENMAILAAQTLPQMWASHATWIRNIKWSWLKKRQRTGFKLSLLVNEPENFAIGTGIAGVTAVEATVRDFPAGLRNTPNGILLSVKRHVIAARAAMEASLGIDLPPGSPTFTDTAYVLGPSLAEGHQTGYKSAFWWGYNDLADAFGGEYMRHIHGLSIHLHRVHSRIFSYTNVEPGANDNCFYNAWAFQQRAMSTWPAGERRYLPIFNDEGGSRHGGIVPSTENGTWNGGTEVYPQVTNARGTWDAATTHNLELRKFRDGMMACAHMLYGISRHCVYARSLSNATPHNMWDSRPTEVWTKASGGDDLGFRPFSGYAHYEKCYDPSTYDIAGFPTVFPTKDFTRFGEPWTWQAYFDMNRPPNETPLTTPVWWGWYYIKFGIDGVTPGEVEMRPWSKAGYVARNLIMRPVWLRYPTKQHVFQCKINFPAGTTNTAKAKIRVRGHNKLWGPENLEVEVVGGTTTPGGGTGTDNWATVSIPFYHTNHDLDVPKANYAILCCDHNAVGTVRFKEPRIFTA